MIPWCLVRQQNASLARVRACRARLGALSKVEGERLPLADDKRSGPAGRPSCGTLAMPSCGEQAEPSSVAILGGFPGQHQDSTASHDARESPEVLGSTTSVRSVLRR